MKNELLTREIFQYCVKWAVNFEKLVFFCVVYNILNEKKIVKRFGLIKKKDYINYKFKFIFFHVKFANDFSFVI